MQHTPANLEKESAFIQACVKGDVERVQALLTKDSIFSFTTQ